MIANFTVCRDLSMLQTVTAVYDDAYRSL